MSSSTSNWAGWAVKEDPFIWDSNIFDDESSELPLNPRKQCDNLSNLVYRCHWCSYKTGSEYHFSIHLAQHSTSPRRKSLVCTGSDTTHPSCTTCGYIANCHTDLFDHETKHRNEAPYLCPYCLSDFISLQGGIEHCKTLHPSMRPYVQAKAVMYARMRLKRQLRVNLDVKVVVQKMSS